MCNQEPIFVCNKCKTEFNVFEHHPHTWNGTCVKCGSSDIKQICGHPSWDPKNESFKN